MLLRLRGIGDFTILRIVCLPKSVITVVKRTSSATGVKVIWISN